METSATGANQSGGVACPHCGRAAPPGALAGLCPACLLRQGGAGDTAFAEKFTPPEPGELAELFPQLEILGLIGSGGMGAVYQARQRGLDRIVALKILPPGIGDRPGFAERFTREAKALAKLSHPGIVTIHDTGRADGLYFLLMEHVDGVTLRCLIEQGKVSPREAGVIVPMICDALQYAHDAGIVHRDIKPENILIDRQGRVKVADFGLAKLAGAEEPVFSDAHAAAPYLTAAGELMGTPLYMAPEQTDRPGDVDHRADIYSLGVVLYQMLTGDLPNADLVAPSHKADLDVRLDEVVLRALERDPARRQQRISEIGHSVETILSAPDTNDGQGTETIEIKFTCPGCGQRLSAEATAAGSEVACPSCSQAMIIPGAPPPTPPPFQPVTQLASLAPPVPKRGTGLAVASLVLALIGLVPVVGLATGAVGLLIGAIAWAKGTAGKGLAIAGTAVGCGAALMIPLHLAMLNATLAAAKFGAGTAHCSQNLKRIGMGIAAYRDQHGGAYPPDLETLVRERFVAAESLRCPLHEGGSGYVYARPVMANPRGIVAWDRFPHSAAAGKLAGRNALDVDLFVRFVPEPQFQTTAQVISGTAPPPKPRAGAPPPPDLAPKPRAARQRAKEPTVGDALDALAKLAPRDKRQPLKFLADANPAEGLRATVVAALKPLLNDVDCGDMAFVAFAKWAGADEVPDMMEIVRIAPGSSRGKDAMRWLSRSADARAAQPLAECLGDFHSLRDAKAALAALGAVGKPAVLPYYHHPDGNAREAARELLRGYQATDDEIHRESIRVLGETDPGSRISALETLAAAKLTAEKRVEASRAVRPLVTDEHRGVADSARKAMKSLATPADADFLLGLVNSPDRSTREFATEILIRFNDARVAEPLAVLLADGYLSYWAGDRLIELGAAAEPAIIPCLSHKHEMTRRRAADTLAKIGTSASIPALQKLAKAEEFFVRVAGDRAIQAIQAREQAGKH